MGIEFEAVKRYLRKALDSWWEHPRFEDAIQEGVIQAWRDVDAGIGPDLKILRRAKLKSRTFLINPDRSATGAPRRSHDGSVTEEGERKREKVRMYMDEFYAIHDRLPYQKEIAQAVGVSESTADRIKRDLRDGRFNHAQYEYTESGYKRLARSYFSEVHLDGLVSEVEKGDASYVKHFDSGYNLEDEVLGDLGFADVLSSLEPEDREILYLRFYLGWNATEIGKHLGISRQLGNKRVSRAVNRARRLLSPENPFTGYCAQGHERTESTTRIVTLVDGRTRRACTVCESNNAEKGWSRHPKDPNYVHPARKKTHCQRGHLIDGERKNGTRYCRTCNRENVRRRKAKAQG